MGCLRCSVCSINWPPQRAHYGTCPGCEEPTSYLSNATPIDGVKARQMKVQFERGRGPTHEQMTELRDRYDAHWAEHDAKHKPSQGGPPPADPRSEHHTPFSNHGQFNRLCALADARRVRVHLKVTDRLIVKAESERTPPQPASSTTR